MNLVLNASESLNQESGGLVTVSPGAPLRPQILRANRTLEEVPEGDYVCLEVADEGSGMTEEMAARIFDPFFTTKFTGRGLGMPAVLGIVRSHKGAILMESRPGQGTAVRVLFPVAAPSGAASDEALETPAADDKLISGTILFVDDEKDMLDLSALELENWAITSSPPRTAWKRSNRSILSRQHDRAVDRTCRADGQKH